VRLGAARFGHLSSIDGSTMSLVHLSDFWLLVTGRMTHETESASRQFAYHVPFKSLLMTETTGTITMVERKNLAAIKTEVRKLFEFIRSNEYQTVSDGKILHERSRLTR